MVACWATFALFVVCCPEPETLAPDEVYCPQYAYLIPDCCTPNVYDKVMAQFGTLSQEYLADAMPQDDYREILTGIREQLFRFLRDIDVLHVDAWRLLAIASLRQALAESDVVKDIAVQLRGPESVFRVWQDAVRASRNLARALFRAESFQQFLLGATAHRQGRLLEGFDPEEVRASFAPVLEVYLSAVRAHDMLAYSLLPQLEPLVSSVKEPLALDPRINLLVVSLGSWAKTGFITIWTALRRTSVRLRIFVLGDLEGLGNWRRAVEELRGTGDDSRELLDRADFEYVDYAKHPNFQAYLRRYPQGCTFGDAGTAILARVVCHEVLPEDVHRVIAIDLGDILVLDDLRGLWDVGDQLEEHHILAAPHAVALHHMNGGLVVYDVRRMRERNFSAVTIRAAEDGLLAEADTPNFDRLCLRDQSIINILHSYRERFGYEGPSPVMALPCRWSVFPATEWQPHWNQPQSWLPELIERRRYPGLIYAGRVEVFCPDEADILSAWAYVPMTERSEEGHTRQSRLRIWAYAEGRQPTRYCTKDRTAEDRCCFCGESAALLHIAGDMKFWPAMQNLLRAHTPPWSVPPSEGALMNAASRPWWGGDARKEKMNEDATREAFLVAKVRGFNAHFGRCVTIRTQPVRSWQVTYHQLELAPQLPLHLTIETTASRDGYFMVGVGGHSGLEIVLNVDNGAAMQMRMVRSSPGWAARGDLIKIPRPLGAKRTRLQGDHDNQEWSQLVLKIGKTQEISIEFNDPASSSFNSFLPEQVFSMLRHVPLSVSVASLAEPAHWGVCIGPAP